MNKKQINTPLYNILVQKFDAFERSLNGSANSNLHEKRKNAFDNFKNLGFPSTKHEEWKYTNLNKLLKEDFSFQVQANLSQETIESYLLKNTKANNLVFFNGVFQKGLSQIIDKNIEIDNFKNAYKNHQDLIDNHFAKHSNSQEEALTALNIAFAENGTFIHVPKNTKVENPVFCYFFTDVQNNNVVVQPYNLFIFEQGSQATLVDFTISIGEHSSWNNVLTEIFVDENAHIKHYKIQNDNQKSYYIGTNQVYQVQNSVYTNTTITLSGNLVRNNLNIKLDGKNIESNMYGLYMLKDNSHVDNHSIADHLQPHSVSNELYKGVLADSSTGVFNGKIFVRQDAQKTNAYQQNRNILLSDNAKINTKPQLEIWADDVKCSHGATTGNLDETALFYLRARGISEQKARALLIHAFANEIIQKIDIEELQAHLEDKINERLA